MRLETAAGHVPRATCRVSVTNTRLGAPAKSYRCDNVIRGHYDDMGTASWSLAFIYHNHNITGGDVMMLELFVSVYSQDLLLLPIHF